MGVDFTVNRSLLALMLGLDNGLILNRRCDLLMHLSLIHISEPTRPY